MPVDSIQGQDGDQKTRSSSGVKVWAFTSLTWLAVIGGVLTFLLLNNREHAGTGLHLTQAQFLDKFESHQISHFVVSYNSQTFPIAQISGRFFTPAPSSPGASQAAAFLKDSTGKPLETPFDSPSVLLTRNMQDELFASPVGETKVRNGMIWSIGEPMLVFIGLGGLFCLGVGALIWYFLRHPKYPAGAA